MIWTPNKLTFLRVLVGFAAVALFGRGAWLNLLAVALTVAAIALDALDGHLARSKKMATPVGAQIDVLGDRIIENKYFTYFAVVGMVSLWLPMLFFARGAATDFLRGLTLKAGHSGWGADAMLQTCWGRALGASRWSRGTYAVLKCLCFCSRRSGMTELPANPIAAFFDIDGTLMPEPSLEKRLFSGLRHSGAIPAWNYLAWFAEAIHLLPQGIAAVRNANKRYLQGISADRVFQLMGTISFYEEALEQIAWHARQGHTILLLSGTLEVLAQIVATALECELEALGLQTNVLIRATRLVEVRGHWTGRVADRAMLGEEKSRAIKEFVMKQRMDSALCYAYGDSLMDRAMLAAVGRPQVVNPGSGLAALANRCDWPIWHWHHHKTMISPGFSRVETKIQRTESHA
jgi:HAD superfamily hydrolase (TIGR01490 family)